jgi:hypothetical protein
MNGVHRREMELGLIQDGLVLGLDYTNAGRSQNLVSMISHAAGMRVPVGGFRRGPGRGSERGACCVEGPARDGGLHVEQHVFDVAGLVEAGEALGECFDLLFRKNEPILGGVVRNSFMFVEFQEGGGALEVALLLEAPLGLYFAEMVQGLLELAGEPLGVHAESGEGAVGVDDIEVDGGLIGGWMGGAVEEGGFEQRDTVEAPRGVGEFVGELGFGRGGGLVFVEELAAVALVVGGVLCGEYGRAAGEAVGEGVEGGTLFAGGGAGSGRETRVDPVGAMARLGGLGASAGGLGIQWICHRGSPVRF